MKPSWLLSSAAPLLLCTVVGFSQQNELRIVVTSPVGETPTGDQSQTIFVTFNQPMIPLKAVSTQDGSSVMQISPPLPGKYRWMGTTTLAFIPGKALPRATQFTVTIAAGTKSLSGQVLAAPHVWTFETPRPGLLSADPAQDQRFVELDHTIHLRFNQPIDPQVIAKYISIVRRTGTETAYPAFVARHPVLEEYKRSWETIPREDSVNRVLLIPTEQFKKSSTITVMCKAGLTGIEGPLGMKADFSLSFTTYNEFSFLGVHSGEYGYEPTFPIRLIFSNPVVCRELAAHLTFDPPLKIPEALFDNSYTSDDISPVLPLQAETHYKGVVKAGLKDNFGQELKADAPFEFTTLPFRPYVHMVTGPGVLEGYESHKYPVWFMNVDSVGVQMGKVDPERIIELMQHLDYSHYVQMAKLEGILLWPDEKSEEAKELTRSTIWKIKGTRNTTIVRPLNLDAVLGPSKTGIAFAQVDNLFKGDQRRFLKVLVQVTNMGITAKFSPDADLIWVTNLKDATPVAGAAVEIRDDSNRVLWNGETNAKGLALAPGWGKLSLQSQGGTGDEGEGDEEGWYFGDRQPHQWVIVRNGDDIAFTHSTWNNGIEPWAFGIEQDWNPQPEKYEGTLFTDRGLYKAGEKVGIKGIVRVRREGGWHIARDPKLQFSVFNSRNEEILTDTPSLSPFGSFEISLPLKPAAPLGSYRMALKVQTGPKQKPVWTSIGWQYFRVEAFRAAEFEVTGKIERKEYVIGDTITGFLSARYLFGAPLKKEPVTWRVSVGSSGWEPPGYDGYFFGSLGWLSRYGRGYGYRVLATQQGTLDDFGSIMVRTPLPVGEIRGTTSLLLEGDVTSPSRQLISGRASVTVHGGDFYVGIRPSTTFLQTDSVLTYGIITVTPDGKPVASRPLSVKVIQRVWNSVRKAETGGRYTWTSEEADSLRDSAGVTTGSGPVERTYIPKHPGFYYIEVSGKDDRGNGLVAETYFYVSGSGYVAWERSNDDRIDLITSKSSYAPGEVAHLIVKSPYESAPALISLEREGIIRHFTENLVGSAPQIDIPITSDMLPNVFVSVVLLQGRVAKPAGSQEGDVGRPSFKVGYVKLSVSPKEHILNVSVRTKGDYRPGDTVSLSLKVKDIAGKGVPAEVSLSVADLGVLNLVSYRLPNPFALFYRERGLAVTTTETRLHLIEQRDYGEKGEDEGGGGAEAALDVADAEGIRKEFRASAYWNPSIRTDATGAATVRFKLPDNLTAFQAMAVAATADSKFGYGDTSFTVSKQLLLQPSLPRFARVGDAFESGVVIINHTGLNKTVTLTTIARGIRMTGGDTMVHTLKPGQAKEVRFSFIAEKIGKAVLTFRARSETDTDGLQWTIPISAPRLRETVALYESTTGERAGEAVIIPDSVYRDIGGLEFSVASTAMIGLSGGMSYLFTYPYWCLEQRSSAILPIILAKDLVEAFHFDVFKDKGYRQVVAKTLDEFPLFQRSDGGFSYWKNTARTWPYLSAFAVYTMVQAQQHGYSVDKKSLEQGLAYLRRALSGQVTSDWDSPEGWRCTRALILYTLALSGTPDHAYMSALYNERAGCPLFAKAYLLKALHLANGDAGMQAELARDLTNRAKIAPTSVHFEETNEQGLWWCYSSTARTTALVMQALIETQPENSLIPKAVRWLLDRQKSGHWRTTQENLYVVDALATYFKTYEKDEPDFRATVSLEGKKILEDTFTGRSMKTVDARVPMSGLTPGHQYPVELTKSGAGRLYYTIRMNYYPQGESVAKEEGLLVTKAMEVKDVLQDINKPFTAGDVVKITLTVVTNQDRNFIVVDDPLPAGFEIINTSFQTTAQNLEGDRQGPGWVFQHTDKYDDHVLLFADYMPAGLHTFSYLARVTRTGKYQMPSTRAEGMYEPEVFGQTASIRVVVE